MVSRARSNSTIYPEIEEVDYPDEDEQNRDPHHALDLLIATIARDSQSFSLVAREERNHGFNLNSVRCLADRLERVSLWVRRNSRAQNIQESH